MDIPLSFPTLVAVGALLVGLALLGSAVRALMLRRRAAIHGRLVSVDRMDRSAPPLRSARYRIVGRPDEIRRLADGRWVPVELKTRSTPRNGPPVSHRIQVLAYCLLAEEASGLPVPYGVVRYSDGGEYRIVWDDGARTELLGVRRALDRAYDGRATPTPPKCLRCPWRTGCDVRAA